MIVETSHSTPSTIADAERLGRELFGLNVTASALPGEFDDNFRITAEDGATYVLKIMREKCDPGFVEMQYQVLQRLAGLPVPRVFKPATASGNRLIWMLDWMPGTLLAETRAHTPELLTGFGHLLGQIDTRLAGFDHPAAHRELKWDLKRAAWIRDYLHHLDGGKRALVESALARYDAAAPALESVRHGVIHGDANDYNVLVNRGEVAGLLDFGDLHHTAIICELAIACAYAAFSLPDPLAAIVHVTRGYHSAFPLEPNEITLLLPLILARLAVSVTNSACMAALRPSDSYVTVSEKAAWKTLKTLSEIHPRLAHYRLREACGLPPVPHARAVIDSLRDANPAPLIPFVPSIVFDLSFGSLLLGADPASCETSALTALLWKEMARAGVAHGIGRYDEARPIYTAPAFASGPHPTDERRTVHIGLDLFAAPGTPVFAPLAGVVHAAANNAQRLDYGPVIVLRHETAAGTPFFTLYGHLDSISGVTIGHSVKPGDRIAAIGAPPDNGDWPPHLHFQILTDDLDLATDFPGVAYASQRDVWLSLSPDPNLIAHVETTRDTPKSETLKARRTFLGGNLSISYRDPLKIVRGWRQYLYDETGRAYLDVYNNVPLVGHSHPRVVDAVHRQMALLNTNTRYLHDTINHYAERLVEKLPAPLNVCYFLNSASEANELALRLARARTGREDIIVLEHAYHGNTNTLIDISPYKFLGPGGRGKKPWVHVAPQPDPYKRDDPSAGNMYAAFVGEITRSVGPAAFIAESLPSVGGQVVFPQNYLAEVYRHVRAAGGVCIADEVQVGFGRLGDYFWGFEMQHVVPDIVVMGKPMGNAFPLAGVVTTREIAESFDNGMEFFSTYGGNPVACAAGLAVLDVLRDERLPENAAQVGAHLMKELRKLDVQDVRGRGLFLGVELETGDHASQVVNQLRDRGILAGTDGPKHNVIKLRPPLIFSQEDAEYFCGVLREIIAAS